eukprot:2286614-Pleurochrysis_carterae.AAC.1
MAKPSLSSDAAVPLSSPPLASAGGGSGDGRGGPAGCSSFPPEAAPSWPSVGSVRGVGAAGARAA